MGHADQTTADMWELHTFGRAPLTHESGAGVGTVLLLPGAMCTSAFYDDVVADPRVSEGDTRWIAATPPGFGGRPVPAGFVPSVDGYAEITADLAAQLGCDTIVGHSYFANVALEMAATGRFSGWLVLLAPCFSSKDEESDTRMLARLARVPGLGRVVWALMRRMLHVGMKGRFTPARQAELVAEMKRIDPAVTRQLFRRYVDHLEEHGSLAPRLCGSGQTTWVVRGDGDEVGLSEDDRQQLEACSTVELVTIPDARHFVMVDKPSAVVAVILEATQRAYDR